jgi:hypothetical protein
VQAAAGRASRPSRLQGEFLSPDLLAPLLDHQLCRGSLLTQGLTGRHEQEQNRCDAHDNSDHVRI